MKLPLWAWRIVQATCAHEHGERVGVTVSRCLRCGRLYRYLPVKVTITKCVREFRHG